MPKWKAEDLEQKGRQDQSRREVARWWLLDKMVQKPEASQRGAAAPRPAGGHGNPTESRSVPTRGYRKGVSDRKTPLPRQLYFRVSTRSYARIMRDAAARGVHVSEALREIVEAHLAGRRAELPHRRGPSSTAIRELARIGNNLNQIARQANLMELHLIETRARQVLDAVNAAIARL